MSRAALLPEPRPDFLREARGSRHAVDLDLVYVGPLVHGGTCLQRMMALQELGCRVVPVDTRPEWLARRMRRLDHRAAERVLGPSDVVGANAALLALPDAPAPAVVWVDKGLTIAPGTLRALRARWPRAVLVSFSPDDMFNPRNQSRAWRAALPLYDLHVTTKTYNVAELLAAGARDVHFMEKGFSPRVHRPLHVTPDDVESLGGDVGFVGWPEGARARSIAHLARHGVPVRVWGPWRRHPFHPPRMRIEGRPLWGDDYARAIAAFRINLGFLRKVNRDRQTTRSIEIPACGGFLLAERTDEHLRLFEEDREAAFFSSDGELLEKARHYLAHEDERAAIAAAALRRCRAEGYDYGHRLQGVLEHALAVAPAARRPLRPVARPAAERPSVAYFFREMSEYIRIDLERIARRHVLTIQACDSRWPRPLRLWRLVRGHDVVMAWFASWHSFWPLLLARALGRPSLVIAGGYDTANLPAIGYGHQRGGLRRWIARATLKLATRVLVVSEYARGEAIAAGADPAKVVRVFHGLDPARYPCGDAPRAVRAITVAGVNESNLTRKGLEAFVRAAALCPEAEFVVVGGGTPGALARLRALAGPNVRFTGRLSHEQKVDWLARSRVIVQASQHEAFGLALAEGMLCGCVPVVTRAGALPEVAGEDAVVIETQDPGALAGAVRAALALGPAAGERSRRRVLERFSLDARAAGLDEALRALLAEAR